MDEKFPNLLKTVNADVQEAKETKKMIPRQSMIKLIKPVINRKLEKQLEKKICTEEQRKG